MSKRQTLMALGIWIIILPFLGFPGMWERILMLASGALIAFIAYRMMPASKPVTSVSANVPYVEHKSEPAPVEQAKPEVITNDHPASS